MSVKDKFVEYVSSKTFDEIAEEQNLEDGEIYLPDEEMHEEFVIVPVGKYEMLIRDSEKLASIGRYIDTAKPTLNGVKIMMEVQ